MQYKRYKQRYKLFPSSVSMSSQIHVICIDLNPFLESQSLHEPALSHTHYEPSHGREEDVSSSSRGRKVYSGSSFPVAYRPDELSPVVLSLDTTGTRLGTRELCSVCGCFSNQPLDPPVPRLVEERKPCSTETRPPCVL